MLPAQLLHLMLPQAVLIALPLIFHLHIAHLPLLFHAEKAVGLLMIVLVAVQRLTVIAGPLIKLGKAAIYEIRFGRTVGVLRDEESALQQGDGRVNFSDPAKIRGITHMSVYIRKTFGILTFQESLAIIHHRMLSISLGGQNVSIQGVNSPLVSIIVHLVHDFVYIVSGTVALPHHLIHICGEHSPEIAGKRMIVLLAEAIYIQRIRQT